MPIIQIPKAIVWDIGMNIGLRYVLKIINAIEKVPNVLNGIRLLNSFMKLSWCNINFKKESNIIYVDMIGFNENLEK